MGELELVQVASYARGLRVPDALVVLKAKDLRVAPTRRVDAALQSDEWRKFRAAFPCWAGPAIAYREPGVALGGVIKSDGLKVSVPEKWRGEKDVALVCEAPALDAAGSELLFAEAKVIPFPAASGWRLSDDDFNIPNGAESKWSDPRARYLSRLAEPFVGLLVRGLGGYRRSVGAVDWPSGLFGVLGVGAVVQSPGLYSRGKSARHVHEWICATCGAVRGKKK